MHRAADKCFEEAQRAYTRGAKAEAAKLSEQGRRYQAAFQEEKQAASQRISRQV